MEQNYWSWREKGFDSQGQGHHSNVDVGLHGLARAKIGGDSKRRPQFGEADDGSGLQYLPIFHGRACNESTS